MTQEEMARALSVSIPQLAGVEQGKRPVGKALSLAFENLFPATQCQNRESALQAISKVLSTKDTNTLWALADFLKRT